MEQAFKVGKVYRKSDIEKRHSEFNVIDFTEKTPEGKPVLKVTQGDEVMVFVKDKGDKFRRTV